MSAICWLVASSGVPQGHGPAVRWLVVLAATLVFFYGMDHLLMMMQAGFLDHQRTVGNIRMFAKEVYPAIKDLARTKPVAGKAV